MKARQLLAAGLAAAALLAPALAHAEIREIRVTTTGYL